MRIVHLSPHLPTANSAFVPEVLALAQAQALASSAMVRVVAVGPAERHTRQGEIELRSLRATWPLRLGHSRALRHHLLGTPLELLHAHCLGERSLHYARLAALHHGAPLILSPAGLLGLGETHRARLRCAALRLLLHPLALEHAAGWHATSPEEAQAIRACGFRQPICVAPVGIRPPADSELAEARVWWHEHLPELAVRPVALFHAPCDRQHRARELIAAWAATFTADWLLLVLGPHGSTNTAELNALAARLGAGRKVIVAAPAEAPPAHAIARLFLRPSRLETSTTAVAEAMAAGLPALVTDTTPWSRLDQEHAGWSVAWSDYPAALRRTLELPSETLAAAGRAASKLVLREFDWPRSAALLLDFYRNLHT
jgi:glycosyltransferase involved in cell wall biosynthesis